MDCIVGLALAFFVSFILVFSGGVVYSKVNDVLRTAIGVVIGGLIVIVAMKLIANTSCSWIITSAGTVIGVLVGFLCVKKWL
ncbi:hypothetical protein E3E23_09335 [Thermococcus sp. CX2]|uniref:hypothetical protein n=1 Tax=Thermococcus sp. CX2 TaxID=163006 RepID=UPI00143BC43D|nr:hypothetical protein [Thermococcus sp. CX2]NJE86022.1 hypothetical protein [Thermococcus sp. CX2]